MSAQMIEPVVAPPGFRAPSFKIGDRVRVALTALAPKLFHGDEGATGLVTCVVFCESDGRTILYGVRFDTPRPGVTGGRFEGFELDAI